MRLPTGDQDFFEIEELVLEQTEKNGRQSGLRAKSRQTAIETSANRIIPNATVNVNCITVLPFFVEQVNLLAIPILTIHPRVSLLSKYK